MSNANKTNERAAETFRSAIARTVEHCAAEGIVNPDDLIKILAQNIRCDHAELVKILGDRQAEIQAALRADVWSRIVA